MHDEPELPAPVLLCGPDGRLNRQAVGWSRHPLHTCNLPPSLARKKKWNYWAVTSNDFLLSATIADVDRLQLGGAYIFDRRTHRHIDKAVVRPPNTIAIPETIGGDMVIEHPAMRVALTDEGAGTRIRVAASDFGGMRLEADILIERPAGHETLNVVIRSWATNGSSSRRRRSVAWTTAAASGRSTPSGTGAPHRACRAGVPSA